MNPIEEYLKSLDEIIDTLEDGSTDELYAMSAIKSALNDTKKLRDIMELDVLRK